MTNQEISKLRHGEVILHFHAWRKKRLELLREAQLEIDEIEVHDYSIDSYSELKIKE